MVRGRKMTNYGPNEILDWNTSFERSLSKLSEKHNNFEIGSIILRLLVNYQLFRVLKSLPVVGGGDNIIICRGKHCRSEPVDFRIVVLQEL